MANNYRIFIFTLFLLMSFTIAVFALGEKNDAKKLVVGMELQFPPFETTDTSGNPSGWSVDFAHALAEYLNMEIEIKNIAWTGLIPAVQTEIVDIVISSMAETEERKKSVDFSIPYNTWHIVSLLNQKHKIKKVDELNNSQHIVAVKIGTTAEVIALEKLPKAEVKKFDTWDAAVLEVAQGRADVALYDPISVYKAHMKYPQTTKAFYQPIENHGNNIAAALKKDNDRLKEKVNAFITQAKKDGTISRISKKYLEEINKQIQAQGFSAFFE